MCTCLFTVVLSLPLFNSSSSVTWNKVPRFHSTSIPLFTAVCQMLDHLHRAQLFHVMLQRHLRQGPLSRPSRNSPPQHEWNCWTWLFLILMSPAMYLICRTRPMGFWMHAAVILCVNHSQPTTPPPRHKYWSPTVPVSVWLPEPARDRGSKQETLNDDFYHTTSRRAAIFGVQTVLSYLVLALNLWIGLCPMKWSSGVWSFGNVSVTYRSRNTMLRYRTSEVPVPNQKLR